MPLTPGTRLGSYEVTAWIGQGGMGEVYRATDRNLGREVAIKVLPDAFVLDAERLARFEREAATLARLNHPHIAQIYSFERADSVHAGTAVRALVMELVEGPTLADLLVRGPLALNDALAIATQIAEAAEGAHDQGIVHRDLKPANIKVRTDGVVKVLDFGLARAVEVVGADDAHSHAATITSPAMTRAGVVLGTASYMSPEQARGLVVDRGADIWAWGCVLFEMLTGERAFRGTDTTEVIAAVIRDQPNWSRLPAETPPSVRRLLRRCLEKDRRQRLADIRDARLAIEDATTDLPAAQTATSSRASSRERLAWAAALLVCIVAGAGVWLWSLTDSGENAVPALSVEITTPPTTDIVSLALSPDGQTLAFVAASEGRAMLWLRSLVTGNARPLAGTDGASFPFWSPDSRSLGFFANGTLFRIDVDGGGGRALAAAAVGTGGSWSRQGVILFTLVPDAPLSSVPADGGEAAFVPGSALGTGGNRFPQFLPDGRRYLYFVANAPARGVYVGTLDGPERRRLFDAEAAAVFVPPAHLLYVRAGMLVVQRFDPTTLALEGDAVSLAGGVAIDSTGAAAASGSSTGDIVYRRGSANRQRQLVWFDRSGRQIGDAFPPDATNPLNPTLSPDGRQLALNRTVAGNADVWILDLERRGVFSRLTTAQTPDIHPVWLPDGTSMVYAGRGGDTFDLMQVSTAGTGKESIFLAGPQAEVPLDVSASGRFVLYLSQPASSSATDLWALPVQGEKTPLPVATTAADETGGAFSPDGRWVAIESDETGRPEIYVQPFPGSSGKTIVSTGGGRQPRWAPSGDEVFYVAPDGQLMAVRVRFATEGRVEPAAPVALFHSRVSPTQVGGSRQEYVVRRDGRFLMNTLVEQTGLPITLLIRRLPTGR